MDVLNYWKTEWLKEKNGWHKKEIHPFLLKYESKLDLASPKRVFIPLCGKSLDMLWFYEGGHEVVGIEGIEAATRKFFEENKLPFTIKELSWAKLYQTQDSRLKIYTCNFYELKEDEIGKFDVFWDRGSLVAIYIEDRKRYVKAMKRLFSSNYRYLLETFHYDGLEMEGNKPPRCISHELVKKLYGDVCEIELLDSCEFSGEKVRDEFGFEEVSKCAYLLSPKEIQPRPRIASL